MEENPKNLCCDGETKRGRRQFLTSVGTIFLAAGIDGLVSGKEVAATRAASDSDETLVKALFDTLTAEQRKIVVLPWNDPKQRFISANWKVTGPSIGSDFYTREQQHLIDRIFRSVTSRDGYERFLRQMEEDYGGFGSYSMAIFGQPGTGQFQWEMTGRHLTIRADGDSVEKSAFGGPIVYGHGVGHSIPGLPGNLFYHQLKKANEVFGAFDEKQRKRALLALAPAEDQVPVQGERGAFPGIPVRDLWPDQKMLVEETMQVILAPYRSEDVAEALALLKQGGGFESLHLAFYESDDLGEDQEWEIWRLEGPTFVWHFRGSPHVHTYVNIARV